MIRTRETWYRNNSFGGSIGTTAAFVLAIAAFLARDLQWLLIVAWPLGCVAVWSLVRSVFATRGEVRLATIMGSLMLGLALLYLHSFMKPVEDLPSADQAHLEIRNTVVPTSRNGSPALSISFYNG